jgi:hypothetical protein
MLEIGSDEIETEQGYHLLRDAYPNSLLRLLVVVRSKESELDNKAITLC